MSQQSGPFDLGRSMNEALALHRQGRLRDAEKIYMRVLKAAPDHFDALNCSAPSRRSSAASARRIVCSVLRSSSIRARRRL